MSYLSPYRTQLCSSCGFAFPTATSGRLFSCPACGSDVILSEQPFESEDNKEDGEADGRSEPSAVTESLTQCRQKHCPHFPHGDCCNQEHHGAAQNTPQKPTLYSIETPPHLKSQQQTRCPTPWTLPNVQTVGILVSVLFFGIAFSVLVGVLGDQLFVTKNAQPVDANNTAKTAAVPDINVLRSQMKLQEQNRTSTSGIVSIPLPATPPKKPLEPAAVHSVPAVPAVPAPPTAQEHVEVPVPVPAPTESKTPEAKPVVPETPKPQPPVTPQQLADAVSTPEKLPEKLPDQKPAASHWEITQEPEKTLADSSANSSVNSLADPPEDPLEKARRISVTEPKKSLKTILQAVEYFRERNLPLPEEVYYLLGQTYASVSWGQPFSANTQPVESISMSPDNTWLLSQHQDAETRIWDLPRQELKEKNALRESKPIRYVQLLFSPDQHLLIGGGSDGMIRIWNIVQQRPEREPIRLRESIPGLRSIHVSPDGRWLAAFGTGEGQSEYSDGNTVFLWDLHQINSGILPSPILLSIEEQQINVVRFSPDSQRLVVGAQDALIRIYDLGARNVSETLPLCLQGHQLGITSLAFSPNGHTLASGGSDNKIILWDLRDASPDFNPIILSGHLGWVNSLIFDSSGSRLFSGSYDNTVRVWSLKDNPLASGELSTVLHTGQGSVRELLLSSDGKHLISLGNDGSMRIQDTQGTIDPKLSLVLRNRNLPISCAALTIDGRWLVFGYENLQNPSESGLRLWSLDTEELITSALKRN